MPAKPKILATKGNFQLVLEPSCFDQYAVYSLESGKARRVELARSCKLTKSVTMWFTKDQIRDVKAKVQAAKRVAKTYGF